MLAFNLGCLSFQLHSKGRWKIAVTTQRFGQLLIEADLGSVFNTQKRRGALDFHNAREEKKRPILEFYTAKTNIAPEKLPCQ